MESLLLCICLFLLLPYQSIEVPCFDCLRFELGAEDIKLADVTVREAFNALQLIAWNEQVLLSLQYFLLIQVSLFSFHFRHNI